MRGSVVLNLLLAVLLAALIGVHWLILPDPSRRNYEFLPDMVVSVARDAQAPGPVLADGTVVDFRPPDGSVVRDLPPFGYAATPEGARLAGEELIGPAWSEDEEADVAARGAFIFNTFCAACHGAAGHGDGPVTKRGVPPPPSLLAEHALKMPDGQMYHVITLGQKNMASYASQVERDDRWKVIRHIRTLQEPPEEPIMQEATAPADPTPVPGTPADRAPERGVPAAVTTETPNPEGRER